MYKVIDLFSGAGGLSFGFMQTGEFEVVAAAEINKSAQKTYLKNHTSNSDILMIDNVIGFDFKALKDKLGQIDIIIGGPPCQGFSNANRQKNHVISMNNSLVKEYFRAIRDIKPKAFVMENVSMLSSKTHRFYDSYKDHDMIKTLGLEMKEDEILISKQIFDGIDLMHIISNKELLLMQLLNNNLFQKLNVLLKNRSNKDNRLEKFLVNNKKLVINQIDQSIEQFQTKDSLEFQMHLLEDIKISLKQDKKINEYEFILAQLVSFQKALRSAKEIYDNELIARFEVKENTATVVAKVESYSVIDYIKAVLKETYKQDGNVVNATWFGVPQERKRYIIMGIHNDIIGDDEIILPKRPERYEVYTVRDAIADLKDYQTSYNKDPESVPIEQDVENLSRYASELRNSTVLHNHIITKTTDNAMIRFKALKEGDNFHNLDDSLKTTYSQPQRTQNTIYLRLDYDKPCGTVVNVRKSMWVHPELDRAISVREAARLQSFPDNFQFYGTKDSQYQQVGNAVPPKLAKAVAECLLQQLKK